VTDDHDIEIGPDRGERRSLTVTPIGAPKGRASAPSMISYHEVEVGETTAAQAFPLRALEPCPRRVSASHCGRQP
jgi:hypothetical protein